MELNIECAFEVACAAELSRRMAESKNWPNPSNGYKVSPDALAFRGKGFNGKDLGKGEEHGCSTHL